jgi:hypothetical protein
MTVLKLSGMLIIFVISLYVASLLDGIETRNIVKANKVQAIHAIADCEANNRKWKYYEGSDDLICYAFPETK